MKELQFTLYELFGYLLPGAVFCAGLSLLFWAIFYPQPHVEFDLKTVEVWVASLGFAYLGGHVAQAIGNIFAKQFSSAEERVVNDEKSFPSSFVKACRAKIAKTLKQCDDISLVLPDSSEPANDLSAQWLYRFCDDAMLRTGKLGEREVYVYREGFYRGAFIGFLVLATGLFSLALRLWFGTEDHKARLGVLDLTGWRLIYFVVLAGIASRLLWNRYCRFADYRVTQALLGYLAIKDKPDEKDHSPKKENK